MAKLITINGTINHVFPVNELPGTKRQYQKIILLEKATGLTEKNNYFLFYIYGVDEINSFWEKFNSLGYEIGKPQILTITLKLTGRMQEDKKTSLTLQHIQTEWNS